MSTTTRKRSISPGDGLSIALLATVIGAIRVGIAVAEHETFGAEATIALCVLILGIIGIAASLWRR